MIHRTLAVAAAALTLTAGAVAAQDFEALARQDLQRIHDELQANHPAPAVGGQAAATFSGWIDTGMADALGRANRVNSGDSHAYLLRYYANGFRDSNIAATPTYEGLGPYFATNWAGVTTGWRNGKYVVTHVAPGARRAPPVGAEVVSCNLTPIEEFARAKLDRWEGDLNTEAGRVQSAPYLLWNRNNPFTSGLPSTCEFRNGRSRPRAYELAPIPVDRAAVEAAYRATVYSAPAQALGVETVNGRPWIHVHSFRDNAGWDAFFSQVESQAGAIRGASGFVLDLRGASGTGALNSTARGYGLANRIWTPEFTVSRQPAAGELTYRATPGNRQWYAETLGRMRADPRFMAENANIVEETAAIVSAFDAALASRQPTFTLQGRPAVRDTGAPNPVQGPVVVLVDAGCSGGCLDTLDLLTRLPNVRIVGSTTAADSIFIEPTVLRLPSNYADLSYGHKAWTSRTRPNNQPFTPAQGLAYTGNPADETAVRTWVGSLF